MARLIAAADALRPSAKPASRRSGSHEGAAADFADDQPAPDQLGVDAGRRGHRDAAGVGKLALRRQPIARPQAAGGDVGLHRDRRSS